MSRKRWPEDYALEVVGGRIYVMRALLSWILKARAEGWKIAWTGEGRFGIERGGIPQPVEAIVAKEA